MGAVAMAEPVGIAVEIEQFDVQQKYINVITDRYNRIYRDVVEIGGMLVQARKDLPYGAFKAMVESKLPFSRASAYRYIEEFLVSQAEAVSPVRQMGEGYSVRQQLEKLSPEQIDAGIAAGRIHQGVSRSQIIEYRRELSAAQTHRPEATATIPAPTRPEGAATTPSEVIWLAIEARKAAGMSQADVDARVSWADGLCSKYEIPHQDDGRVPSLKALCELCQAIGYGIKLVPLQQG